VPGDLGPGDKRSAPGGFGLFLLHRAMDEIAHRALAPGNELTMVKKGVITSD